MEQIVDQTNLYAVQQRPERPLKLLQNELEQFLGCIMWMSLVKISRIRRYWGSRYKQDLVADVMTLKRFEDIKRFLHFNDNDTENKNDKLRKVRPVVSALRKSMLSIPKVQSLCVDEQIIPFKGRSVMKQYNKRKPHKWGYKVFVLSGISGFSYDLEVYTGVQHELEPNEVDIGASSNVVMRLCRTVPTGIGYHMYLDNYFTSLRMLTELAQRQIQSIATVRLNRLPGLRGPSEAEMKMAGRGTVSEYLTDVDVIQVSCVRWFDNKLVSLFSTFVGAVPIGNARIWFRKENIFKEIARPQIISIYNKHMGGVDTLDSLTWDCTV